MLRVRNHHTSLYKDVLSHTVRTTTLFNSGASTKTRFSRFLERVFFFLIFVGLTFIATLAVFARSGIDTWIQFSLYIVPLISMMCGHLIFKSSSFKEILNRCIKNGSTEKNEFENSRRDNANGYIKDGRTLKGLSRFLRTRSIKTCFYPFSLVVYQWSLYLIFYYVIGNSQFSGPFRISEHSSYLTRRMHLVLNEQTWLSLYCIFWTVAMYVAGFVACCFILIADIHKMDIKSFLFQIGNGPMIQKTQNYRPNQGYQKTRITNHGQYQAIDHRVIHPVGFLYRLTYWIIGFLTLGVVELASNPLLETHKMSSSFDTQDLGNIEVSDSGATSGLTSSLVIEEGKGETSHGERGNPPNSIAPRDASRLLIQLMTSLETNSSLFKPFLVLLTFFSVTNLVTHVAAMAIVKINGFTDLHWWTLMRTLIWFLLAIRLLWTVATITNTLTRIVPHIYYLRSVGELTGDKQEWDDFFQLAETFQFGSRTYGFPLTLNQVASIVAVVNFSFLIVLSLISKTQN